MRLRTKLFYKLSHRFINIEILHAFIDWIRFNILWNNEIEE